LSDDIPVLDKDQLDVLIRRADDQISRLTEMRDKAVARVLGMR
jgi:hypothetical protein